MRVPSRLLMTCLDLFVRCAEINQWPLDVIIRIHVHMRDRKAHRHENTKRQIIALVLSPPDSLFPFYAKAGLKRLKRGFCRDRMRGRVFLPCLKHDNSIAQT